LDDRFGLVPSGLKVLSSVDGLEHGGDQGHLFRRYYPEDVSVEVDRTALPSSLGIKLSERFDKAHAGITDEESNAFQAPFLQVPQEAGPAGLVLLGAFDNAEDLAVTVLIDPDSHEHGDVGHFTGPGTFQHDPVEVDIGICLRDRLIPPGFNGRVDLLVEVADGSGTDLGAPEGFGDVLDPPDTDPGQIHLDEGLLHRTLSATVSLDDGGLEGLLPELGHVERDLAGPRVEPALVMTGPGILPSLRTLVFLGIAQPIGFGFEHLIQRLFHCASDHLPQVVLHSGFVEMDDFFPRSCRIGFHGSAPFVAQFWCPNLN